MNERVIPLSILLCTEQQVRLTGMDFAQVITVLASMETVSEQSLGLGTMCPISSESTSDNDCGHQRSIDTQNQVWEIVEILRKGKPKDEQRLHTVSK